MSNYEFDMKIKKLVDSGMTQRKIADALKVTRWKVRKSIERLASHEKDVETVADLLRDGYSSKKVAELSGLDHDDVTDIMTIYDLKEIQTKQDMCFYARDYDEYVDDLFIYEDEVEETSDVSYIITKNNIVIVKDDEPLIISRDNPNFPLIAKALEAEEYSKAYDLINIKKTIERFVNGKIEIKEDGTAYYNGNIPITNMSEIADIIDMVSRGEREKAAETSRFLERVMKNPSNNVVNRIYDFCKHNDVSIDDNGYIICFKRVNGDYTDCYSQTFDNSPGNIVSVTRNQVDEDPDKTCSYGLHVCSKSYLQYYYGDRIIRVRVDPADIVAIPRDYNDSKVRCCEYYVIDDVTDTIDLY